MNRPLATALEQACRAVRTTSRRIGVNDLNESVFRFLLASALLDLDAHLPMVFECQKVDLAMRHRGRTALVEIKYYVDSPVINLTSFAVTGSRKSFPSPGSFRNFANSIALLREKDVAPESDKYLVLFYADRQHQSRRTTYSSYYEQSSLEATHRIRRLHSVAPFQCRKTGAVCAAHLFKVQA